LISSTVGLSLIIHGLVCGKNPELGRDADTGGQIKYVLELANKLAQDKRVTRVDLLTRMVIDKKVDPKKLQFGSKIDRNSKSRQDYHTIKAVIAPDLIELNNGQPVKLIGIVPIENKESAAIKFIMKKTNGQNIYLKYDEEKYDSNNNMLCYVFLKNKTFINAHLIKNGLASADLSYNYKYKKKFIKYMETVNGKRMDSK